ncbi:hypothetical protein Clacol_006232 [Clathrus columnatus]|uniref:Uncharacterized protein n=1 Tax=Clathrus columnatus TaxID=1419009 RepID=A0AAV5AH40_9AGAM|nr:hypothetical protein Clacol_006232 [Clathrus columnatus]
MTSTFTPSNNFKEGPEKEWAGKLGALDWDNSHIVFTKRSLIEFLRHVGVTTDPNFQSISKLPRYAEIGKMVLTPVDPNPNELPTESSGVSNETLKNTEQNALKDGGAINEPSRPEAAGGSGTLAHFWDAPENEPAYRPSRRVRERPGGHDSIADILG